ncbi:LPXTG cell wall anchor domain-containing protein, partial [Clostridium sp.]|uniref:LPXTG cell wall anchor domain-containing protein n=1 Tax=Clostridium sp. TaxID=1506 RepID=UPI003079CE9F
PNRCSVPLTVAELVAAHRGERSEKRKVKILHTTEPVTPVVPEPQPVVPAEGLPKTGDTDQMDVPMALLAIGMMAAAYVLMTGRKKTEE